VEVEEQTGDFTDTKGKWNPEELFKIQKGIVVQDIPVELIGEIGE
jgi:hypothetical protein